MTDQEKGQNALDQATKKSLAGVAIVKAESHLIFAVDMNATTPDDKVAEKKTPKKF
jgi:hypothetical protein